MHVHEETPPNAHAKGMRLEQVLATGCVGNMPCAYFLISPSWGSDQSYASVRFVTNKSVDYLSRGNNYQFSVVSDMQSLLETMSGAHPIGRGYAYRNAYKFSSPTAEHSWSDVDNLIQSMNLRRVSYGPDLRSWIGHAQNQYKDLQVYAARA